MKIKSLFAMSAAVMFVVAPNQSAIAQSKTEQECKLNAKFCLYHWHLAGYPSQEVCLEQTFDPDCSPDPYDPRGDPVFGNPYADKTYGCGSIYVTC
jgi:hypothetical protein